MTAPAHAACQFCRKNKKRCTGGPPCQNCVKLRKETCDFVRTANRRKRIEHQARIESDACGPCRMKRAPCTGGPPCEECYLHDGLCTFELGSHHEEHLLRISQDQADVSVESPWSTILEMDPILQPESPAREECDSGPSFYTRTALDTRRACCDQSLEATAPNSKPSNLTALSELSGAPSLNVGSSDNAVDASSPGGRASYEQLLDDLPSREVIDDLVERYFTSISTASLGYHEVWDIFTDNKLAVLYHRRRHL